MTQRAVQSQRATAHGDQPSRVRPEGSRCARSPGRRLAVASPPRLAAGHVSVRLPVDPSHFLFASRCEARSMFVPASCTQPERADLSRADSTTWRYELVAQARRHFGAPLLRDHAAAAATVQGAVRRPAPASQGHATCHAVHAGPPSEVRRGHQPPVRVNVPMHALSCR
jgi:hypothetical protein